MRKINLLLSTLLVGAMAAFGPMAFAANYIVGIGDDCRSTSVCFGPDVLIIQVGDSVTFYTYAEIVFTGPHNVVADDGSFRCARGCDGEGGDGTPRGANGTPTGGWSFTRTFNTAGNVAYHDEVTQVRGTIIVTADPVDLNQHGLTGSWYNPATQGQGVEIEVFPNLIAPGTSLIQGAWFTFPFNDTQVGGADTQRWYTFSGNGQSGSFNVSVAIYQNSGGDFAASPPTAPKQVGHGTLTFADCNTATLAYEFDNEGLGWIALTRLTKNITCAIGSTKLTNADFSLSGNWYKPSMSGQGFVFDVNPLSRAFVLAWYTYAPRGQLALGPRQRWFTGLANYVSGTRTVTLELYETTGGLLDRVTNPAPSSLLVGNATVAFASCTSAQLTYAFTGGSNNGASGNIALSRIGPVPPGCVP